MKHTGSNGRYSYMMEPDHRCWLCGRKVARLRQLPDSTLIHLCDRCFRIFQDAMFLDAATSNPPAAPDIAR